MQTVSIDELDDVPHFMGANTVRKPLSRVVEGMGFSMNYFELDTGEGFSGGLHTHHDQEELFYIQEGTATFEVRAEPDSESDEIEVGPGEAVHFARDDVYQTGTNRGERRVVGFALGIPGARHEWQGVEAVIECPDCERDTAHDLRPDEDGRRMPDAEEMAIICRECGYEH